MAKRGLELLIDGFKNLLDGIVGAVGGLIHTTGSTARGIGQGTKRIGEGLEEGFEEAGKGVGYTTHGAGYGVKATGRLVERLGRKVSGTKKGMVEISRRDFEELLELEPEKLERKLEHYITKASGTYVRNPAEDMRYALQHARASRGHTKYHSPLEHKVHDYTAAILFGIALVFLLPMSITGATVYTDVKQGFNFFTVIAGIMLTAAIIWFFKQK